MQLSMWTSYLIEWLPRDMVRVFICMAKLDYGLELAKWMVAHDGV